MSQLIFAPADGTAPRSVALSPSTSLLVALMKSGAFIRHDCGGRALCGTCRIEIKGASGLSPMRFPERERLEALGLAVDGRIRLACQTHASRDVEARGCLAREDR